MEYDSAAATAYQEQRLELAEAAQSRKRARQQQYDEKRKEIESAVASWQAKAVQLEEEAAGCLVMHEYADALFSSDEYDSDEVDVLQDACKYTMAYLLAQKAEVDKGVAKLQTQLRTLPKTARARRRRRRCLSHSAT